MGKVVVVFQADTEQVEQLALAAAVGAVQAEALIRLRRLAGADAPEVGHKSYGRLQAADLAWADALLVFLEDAKPNFEELDPMLHVLSDTVRPGATAWTFRGEGWNSPKTEAQMTVEKALLGAGFAIMAWEEREDSEDRLAAMKRLGHLAGESGSRSNGNP